MVSTVFGGPAPLFLLLLALAVDAALGDRLARWLPDPALWARRLFAGLEGRLNRPRRSAGDRLLRGALSLLVLLALAVGLGTLVEWIGGEPNAGWAVELLVMIASLHGRREWARVRNARRALERNGGRGGRSAVAGLTRRPVAALDEHALVRLVIEHAATAFDRGLVAPAFWYVLLGCPGLLAWAAVDGACMALGGQAGLRHTPFGLTAWRMDDALDALPARLAALLLALAAGFLGGASLPRAVRAMWKDAGKGGSLNRGWPLAAAAGALDLSLGGPYRDGGVSVERPWIGPGRARAVPADIGRALALAAVAGLLTVLAVGLLLAGVASL